MKNAVVTGYGCVTPFGIGVPGFRDALRVGRSGTRKLEKFEPDRYITCHVAADVPDFDHELYIDNRIDKKRLSPVVPMTWLAAGEAFAMAGIRTEKMTVDDLRGIDVVIGSAGGGIEYGERQYAFYYSGRAQEANPYAIPSSIVGMLPSEISIRYGLRGMSHAVSNGCTSSTDAVGYALRQIQSGNSTTVITGGADACITKGLMAGYCLIRAMPTKFNDMPERASRPFNIDRDGFVLGEGAWIIILEEEEHARRRGAAAIAEVAGYASTCDAYHRVQIKDDAVESARAVELALADAGAGPAEVDYVNLHGTSTALNDKLETIAMKLVFEEGAYSIPMSATKSMIGHPQGASGAAGIVATLIGMEEGFLPPTINYENPDPECDLDYVPNESRNARLETAVCNCIGFGSKNSAVVLKNRRDGDRAEGT
jgi:3-oxoacyl-[acyl-carrier-protein] synthase II